MGVSVKLKVVPAMDRLIARLGSHVTEGMSAAMAFLLATLEAHAVKEAPVETSDLVNSITHYLVDRGRGGVVKATSGHAILVHEGTGIYGPRKRPIVPKEKKALFWPGARHPVRSVKGQRPNPFFERAVKKTNPQKEYEEGLRNYLKRRGW